MKESTKKLRSENRGLNILDTIGDRGSLVTKVNNVEVMLSESRQRMEIENKAWIALDKKLTERNIVCKKCGGAGELTNGDDCHGCGGMGFYTTEADMKAIDLVLSPKFPKTSINVNADIAGMNKDDLLDMINRIT